MRKIGRIESEEVIFEMIKSKCLPILLYGSDSCPTNAAVKHCFEFTVNRVLSKIFGVLPKGTYRNICKYCGVDPVEELVSVRQSKEKLNELVIFRRCCSADNLWVLTSTAPISPVNY